MSIAPRLTKCLTCWKTCPGQPERFGQIVKTPSSGFTVGVPHAGHFFGGFGLRRPFGRLWISGETTAGMTSPARMTTTSSPSRTSLRARSSSLWRVAVETVTPPTWTGSSIAKGSRWPVRPTFQTTLFSRVVAVVGGNFQAIAQRGSRPTTPSSRQRGRSSTLTTTPSISKSSSSRRPSHQRQRSTTASISSWPPASGLTLKPRSRSHSISAVWVGRSSPRVGAEPVAPDREGPARRDGGVELADRAGGGVAGVGEGRLAGLRAGLVEVGEGRDREVHLAADLYQRRRVRDPQRDRPDRPQVVGDVLADPAVAAGRAAGEDAVLVGERHRQPVDLRLGRVADLLGGDVESLEQVADPLLPGAQLLLVAGVAEREHRLGMLDLGEAVERVRSHPLGRRVGCAQLGVGLLELAQLGEQRVVDVVADLGVVEDVVAVIVVLDRLAQLRRALRRPRRRRAHASVAATAAASSIPSRPQPRSSSNPPRSVRSKWTGVTDIRPLAIAERSEPCSSSNDGSKP